MTLILADEDAKGQVAEAVVRESARKSHETGRSFTPHSVWVAAPKSQIRKAPSIEPEIAYRPSGVTATDRNFEVFSVNVCTVCPVSKSHTRRV
jgi:hypothetical protein